MRNLILAGVSALALLGVAACSDNTDNATTQSVTPPAEAPAILHDRPLLGGLATAYLCEGLVCKQPTTEPEELESQL